MSSTSYPQPATGETPEGTEEGAAEPQMSASDAMVRHQRGLRAYFGRRLRQPDEAEDYVQEVFTRVLSGIAEENVQHWGGFLYRVASNLLKEGYRRDHARHRSQHVVLDDVGELAAPDSLSPERIALGRDALRHLEAALLEMPARRRDVFVLIRFEGKSYREVARMLDMTESAVGKQLDKAVAFLARRRAEEA